MSAMQGSSCVPLSSRPPAGSTLHPIALVLGLTYDQLTAPHFSSHSTFDAPIYDNFYEADDHDAMAPNPKRVRSSADAPELPRKSALRASRLLDNLGLQLGGSIGTAVEPGQATPLDVYLSSEEDASSDADDFSDYGYDSSNEDPTSPTRRSSHEDTARVVSVVYSGKPSIIDLSLLRRSISPNSTRTRSSTTSSRSPIDDRPSTAASSIASSPVQSGGNVTRKPSLLSDLLVKKRPPFLNIDPYANGSTYSLEIPNKPERRATENDSITKAPKTPTQILRGVSRTFSLVRKRSRPLLGSFSPQPQPHGTRDSLPATSSPAQRSSSSPTYTAGGNPTTAAPEHQVETKAGEVDIVVEPGTPQTPQTPVTYSDIIRAAKKNAMMIPPSPMTSQNGGSVVSSPVSSQEPTVLGTTNGNGQGAKRGILSGLAARRRSIKLTGKVI
ncbi:hypothetical protein B0H67DRAFT_599325 [Lasiosphaeris hirsuta]|uniref:Uncharacterized protein n=1 Tax=Lasiosphaeris hirsuta TaxID=260670 RepID=A0AA40APJ9_9PEZI|nr:hypothetical protein B0H67DRAFT_599325 [Lasiosphaeris hirsuta]